MTDGISAVPATKLPHEEPRSAGTALRRYVLAVAVVGLTLTLKLTLSDLGSEHPFVLLTAAVALAAWYGGRGPGLLAAVLVSVATGYLFLPAGGRLAQGDLVGLAGLFAEGILVVWLTVSLRSARERAEAAGRASRAAHRETAFALAVRDEMLTLWTQQLRGPLADLEADARDTMGDLERDGYAGNALAKLQSLIDEAALVGRATANWERSHSGTQGGERT